MTSEELDLELALDSRHSGDSSSSSGAEGRVDGENRRATCSSSSSSGSSSDGGRAGTREDFYIDTEVVVMEEEEASVPSSKDEGSGKDRDRGIFGSESLIIITKKDLNLSSSPLKPEISTPDTPSTKGGLFKLSSVDLLSALTSIGGEGEGEGRLFSSPREPETSSAGIPLIENKKLINEFY